MKGEAIVRLAGAAILAAAMAGCVSSPRFTTHTVPPRTEAASPGSRPRQSEAADASSEGHAGGAAPTAGRVDSDADHSLLMTQGLASYYADEFHGRMTANGETYDMYQLTAAHRSLPFGTVLRVTNMDNQKFVIVRINDRGPFKMERIIDLSLAAATQLHMMGVGTARVQLDVIEWGDGLYKK